MTTAAANLRSNRDLYLHVGELARTHRDHGRSLESYLRALRALVRAGAYGDALALGTFAALLAEAFDHPVPPDGSADEASDPTGAAPAGETQGRAAWEESIAGQIADLRWMAAEGRLHDEMRYFGIDLPSGARWYNFVPCSYIECGVAGTFGGWDAQDETGRVAVPGPVAAIDTATGKLTAVDPADLVEPVVSLTSIDWDQFTDFLEAGAFYE